MLLLPSSPGLEGSEHSTLSGHVTEGGLTGSVSTRTRHSWNSGHGSTSTPGFGTVLHTRLGVHSVGLSGVLGKVRVHELNDIQSDRGCEDRRERDFLSLLINKNIMDSFRLLEV